MTRSLDAFRDVLLSALLNKARTGSAEALGSLFETCRRYLLRIAQEELAASLRAKVDAADVVQETFIEAFRGFSAFRGTNRPQLLRWLRGILRHNIADLVKRFDSRCRCVSQEVTFSEHKRLSAASSPAFRAVVGAACDQVIAREQRHALNDAVERLPPLYRRVIQLHFGECCSFAEIGNDLHRSPEAVRKVARRAVDRLRHEMRAHAAV